MEVVCVRDSSEKPTASHKVRSYFTRCSERGLEADSPTRLFGGHAQIFFNFTEKLQSKLEPSIENPRTNLAPLIINLFLSRGFNVDKYNSVKVIYSTS